MQFFKVLLFQIYRKGALLHSAIMAARAKGAHMKPLTQECTKLDMSFFLAGGLKPILET